MQKSLIALETNDRKGYVFQTDRLKEMRGASLLLDRLNRLTMVEIAREPSIDAELVYVNGGTGLFLIDDDKAYTFGKRVQRAFLESSGGGSSITYAVQRLPANAPEDREQLMMYDLGRELELLRYKLHEEKGRPHKIIAAPAHPFLRPCDACGLEYAKTNGLDQRGTRMVFYCASCKEKQDEDGRVGEGIEHLLKATYAKRKSQEKYNSDSALPVSEDKTILQKLLWDRLFFYLEGTKYKYLFDDSQPIVERPNDFNAYHDLSGSKEYLGLVYADANNIGAKIETLTKLVEIRDLANQVDQAIQKATFSAIEKHLPLSLLTENRALFPFDILLLGGDKVIMVTDASKAMDVSLTIAQEFRALTKNEHTLSVGVVLAPIKYPFGLLLGLAESTLDFAKRRSADVRLLSSAADDTNINFMTVSSGTLSNFDVVYSKMHRKRERNIEFYATLRPYTTDKLRHLLNAIRKGNRLNLGRNNLYRLREAVYKMNLTQSVADSLAILRNWQEVQQSYIVSHVYQFGGLYQMPHNDTHDPIGGFPRVTFPWFADDTSGKKGEEEGAIYRTPLLDFVELYDFVFSESGEMGGEN